jgi:hypothetical protein
MSLCEHNRKPHRCLYCGNNTKGICEHNKEKCKCLDCHGASICEHNRRKSRCRLCHGSEICDHNRRREQCKECHGILICDHKKIKSICGECKGRYICKSPGCTTIASNKQYNGFCLRCCIYNCPDINVVRNYKTKEKTVVDRVCEKYTNFTWVLDKRVEDGCSRRRPDLLLDLGDQVLIIEVDENQHYDYDCSCENKRLMEISRDVGHRPLVFIRFNPDDYATKEGKHMTSCWHTGKDGILRLSKKSNWDARIESLFQQIDYWTVQRTNKTIEVIQLFYDNFA